MPSPPPKRGRRSLDGGSLEDEELRGDSPGRMMLPPRMPPGGLGGQLVAMVALLLLAGWLALSAGAADVMRTHCH